MTTAREVDGFGEVIQKADPDRGTRIYGYDAEGRLAQWIDGDGEEMDCGGYEFLREDSYESIQHSTASLDDEELGRTLLTCGYDVQGNTTRPTLTTIILEVLSLGT